MFRDGRGRDTGGDAGDGDFGDGGPGDRDERPGDEALFRDALGRVAGPLLDPYASLRRLEPRLTARRRPGAVWLTAAAATVALVVALAGARSRPGGVRVVSPGDGSEVTSTTADGRGVVDGPVVAAGDPSSTTALAISVPPAAATAAVGNGDDATLPSSTDAGTTPVDETHGVGQGTSGDTDGSVAEPGGGGSGHGPVGTGRGGTDAPNGGAGSATTSAPVAPPPPPREAGSTTTVPGRQTITVAGGGVTIDFDGRRMRIVSVDPAAGYTADVAKDEPDRIEIRFHGRSGETQLRLGIESGRVVTDVQRG